MPDRIDVFISSTSRDLEAYRERVMQIVLRLGAYPILMEAFNATDRNALQKCYDEVQQAEVFIGLYAHRYGFAPRAEMTYTTVSGEVRAGDGSTSITYWEYLWAQERGIPTLLFLVSDQDAEGKPIKWELDFVDPEPAKTQLNAFKTLLKGRHVVSFFHSPDHLAAQVAPALGEVLQRLRAAQPAESTAWEAGVSFDHYTLRTLLGTGGNGQVWLADYSVEGITRTVAVKALHAHISQNPTRDERFRREIRSMVNIRHPHIVDVLHYGTRGGQLYVILRYLSGGTLRARLTGDPLPEATALDWLEQIGAALDYVHDRHSGMIHRDVKPENMLFDTEEGSLYLADFGLVFSAEDDDALTDEGKPAGTGRYMAPEQWRGAPLSRQTDLYALGILAYELLTGHLPFTASTDYLLAQAHCEHDLPPDTYLTDEVLRILRKATAKDPAERYPTARAFLSDLRNWRADPANLAPRVEDYLDYLTGDIRERVLQRFVELSGSAATLRPQPMPRRRRKHYADDEEEIVFTAQAADIHADHVAAHENERSLVENVRARLMTLERVVLIGEPGSGKTFMLQRLSVDYARAWQERRDGRIPVLVYLNEYNGGSFADFVRQSLDLLAPYHDRLLREGRLVLLCDALNEMPRGAGQMQALINYLQADPNLHFVVSCRVRDYRDDLNDLKPLEQVLLRDLELLAIRELIHKRLPEGAGAALWRAMGGTEALVEFWQWVQKLGFGEHFWEVSTNWYEHRQYDVPNEWHTKIRSGTRLIPLARNPYMGDLLCRTYAQAGDLPGSRAELFGRFIGEMLRREAKAAARRGEGFPLADLVQQALVGLARALQAAKRTVLAESDALVAIRRALAEAADDQRAGVTAEALLRTAVDASILNADGDGLRFAHQLLQEYFAARILLEALEQGSDPREFFGAEWWDAGVWRETTVILGEFLGEGAGGANRVARWLAAVSPEVALQVLTRSNAGLTLADVQPETKTALIASARAKTGEPNAQGRAAAYRVLGLLDADDRPGVGLQTDGLPDIDWVLIPAGEFTYQDDKMTLNYDFYIARYPITYRQFQAFLDDPAGFHETRWWDGLADDEYRRKKQAAPGNQAFKFWNCPRENVSWYDAIAFCHWLTAKYQQAGLIPPLPAQRLGKGAGVRAEIRLPTEFEWEKAARANTGWQYPYGSTFDAAKGNTNETGFGHTSAVGMFPAGDTPHWDKPIADLSGNVFEWCLTAYGTPQVAVGDENLRSNITRVLRGGSWRDLQDLARAVFRNGSSPDNRYSSYGFRVVCVRPPSTH